MKHTFLNFNKIIAGLFISGFLTFSAVSASAKPFKKTVSTVSSIVPQVKYVGTDANGASLVEVYFETAAPVKFQVSMTDAGDQTVYSSSFESSKFHKVFKLVNEHNGTADIALTLAIRLLPGGETHYYSVSSNYELVNSITITRN